MRGLEGHGCRTSLVEKTQTIDLYYLTLMNNFLDLISWILGDTFPWHVLSWRTINSLNIQTCFDGQHHKQGEGKIDV